MFYRHWKKIALARTAFFWASCNNNSTITDGTLYGCLTDDCSNPTSESSSDALLQTSSSNDKVSSSSQILSSVASSSNLAESSSSNELIACKRLTRVYDTIENGKNYISSDCYECNDGRICEHYDYSDFVYCTDNQGNSISYTKKEFFSKYYYCYDFKNEVICYINDVESM